MGIPMDYGSYAATYATARWAMPWIVDPLLALVRRAPRHARIVEIGCGTGNYLEALRDLVPPRGYVGLDRSIEMLAQAVRRGGEVRYAVADADGALPLGSGRFALAFVFTGAVWSA